MKKFFPYIAVLLVYVVISSGYVEGTTYTPGQQSTPYKAGSLMFYMRYVPSGIFTSDDSSICSDPALPTTIIVNSPYWIAETEVTYQLWCAIYDWAKNGNGSNGTGKGRYTFANPGLRGGYNDGSTYTRYSSDHDTDPVTTISWRDAVVWCNALTEYYNAQNGTNLDCVYKTGGNPIRKADATCDVAVPDYSAKGFRLPTSAEWELAARYQNGINWTPGNHVSGDTTGPCWTSNGRSISTVFGKYAWFWDNSLVKGNHSTQPVGKSLQKNALGISDMSGNVWEWCFDLYPGHSYHRVCRGGCWTNVASSLQLGYVSYDYSNVACYVLGFRPVRDEN